MAYGAFINTFDPGGFGNGALFDAILYFEECDVCLVSGVKVVSAWNEFEDDIVASWLNAG